MSFYILGIFSWRITKVYIKTCDRIYINIVREGGVKSYWRWVIKKRHWRAEWRGFEGNEKRKISFLPSFPSKQIQDSLKRVTMCQPLGTLSLLS